MLIKSTVFVKAANLEPYNQYTKKDKEFAW